MFGKDNKENSNEKVLYEGQPNIIVYSKNVFIAVIFLGFLFFLYSTGIQYIGNMQVYLIESSKLPMTRYFAIAVFVVIMIVILYIIIKILIWTTIRYTITESRVIVEKGLIFNKKNSMPFNTIQDVGRSQNILGKLFSVGSITLYSAYDGKDLELNDISNPKKVEELIFENMRTTHLRARNLYGDSHGNSYGGAYSAPVYGAYGQGRDMNPSRPASDEKVHYNRMEDLDDLELVDVKERKRNQRELRRQANSRRNSYNSQPVDGPSGAYNMDSGYNPNHGSYNDSYNDNYRSNYNRSHNANYNSNYNRNHNDYGNGYDNRYNDDFDGYGNQNRSSGYNQPGYQSNDYNRGNAGYNQRDSNQYGSSGQYRDSPRNGYNDSRGQYGKGSRSQYRDNSRDQYRDESRNQYRGDSRGQYRDDSRAGYESGHNAGPIKESYERNPNKYFAKNYEKFHQDNLDAQKSFEDNINPFDSNRNYPDGDFISDEEFDSTINRAMESIDDNIKFQPSNDPRYDSRDSYSRSAPRDNDYGQSNRNRQYDQRSGDYRQSSDYNENYRQSNQGYSGDYNQSNQRYSGDYRQSQPAYEDDYYPDYGYEDSRVSNGYEDDYGQSNGPARLNRQSPREDSSNRFNFRNKNRKSGQAHDYNADGNSQYEESKDKDNKKNKKDSNDLFEKHSRKFKRN